MLLVERTYLKPQIVEATAAKLPDGVLLRLVYPVCNIGELNANKRMYERELWDLVLANRDLQEKLSNRNLYGQAEHPKETASDLQLTSHIIHEMWIADDNRVYQTFDVLDTPCGRIIECLIRAGSRVGVSTRAEGDLEEAVDEGGNKYHRVVPKSYRYVTTDFTADPSTFGAMAVDVKRNVISAARVAVESKDSKLGEVRFARKILESLQCDHKHTCQNCGACKCYKGEASDMTKTTVAEQIKSGKLTEGAVLSVVLGTGTGIEKKFTSAKVSKINEGRMDIMLNSADPNSKSLTVDGTDAVTIRPDGTIDVFATAADPYAAAQGFEDDLKNALGQGEEEGGPAPDANAEAAASPEAGVENAPGEDEKNPPPVESKANEGCSGKTKDKKKMKKNESKVDETIPSSTLEQQKLVKLMLAVIKDKQVNYTEALKIVARMIDETPEVVDQHVAKAIEVGRSPDRTTEDSNSAVESKVPPLDALIDLRIKEACTRAERDALLENRDLQVRVLSSRLRQASKETAGLRTMVEKKAKALKESAVKKPDKDVQKLNEKIQGQHVAHQQELVETANKSIREGRSQVLKDYFGRRLSACRLEADDNTQALLEKCQSLDDVDRLIESLVQVARRGALHPKSVKDVVVREGKTDPEQDKVDRQVGSLMKGWSA